MPDGDTEADWREQGESLLMSNRCAEALDLYMHILEAHPDEPAAWVVKARALAAAIPGCHATFYPNEGHDTFGRHTREILTTLTSGDANEQNRQSEEKASDLPRM